MKDLSIVGRGYLSNEKVIGFYTKADRITFWGSRGAFWGGLWGLFFGGIFVTIPITGPILVLGYLASVLVAAAETALVVGGLSALGAALYGIGVPKNSVVDYETDMEEDRFLVMAHGPDEDVERARRILSTLNPTRLNVVRNNVPIAA